MNKKIISLLAFTSILFSVPFTSKTSKVTSASEIVVYTFEEIRNAALLEQAEVKLGSDIVIENGTDFIEIPYGHKLKINGDGHFISAAVTGINDYGQANDDATDVSFFLNHGDLSFENVTVRGGKKSFLVSEPDNSDEFNADSVANPLHIPTLKFINFSAEKSGSPTSFGGVFNASDTNALIYNSKFSRNIADHGGGFLFNGGYLIAENSSFNENRSCYFNGGGGAAEIGNCSAIFNNCTFANNSSPEIGGAINANDGSRITFLNCNIVGNVSQSQYGRKAGGGIGINTSKINLINSNISSNFTIDNGNIETCDLGLYYPTFGLPTIFASSYRAAYGEDPDNDFLPGKFSLIEGNYESKNKDEFLSYAKGSSLIYDGTEFRTTKLIERPIIVLNEKNTYEAYLNKESSVLTGGCSTYLSYDKENIGLWDHSNITVGYKKDGVYTGVDGDLVDDNLGQFVVPTDESSLITTFQDGSERISGVIGSSNYTDKELCLFTILPGKACSITGGTLFGDVYLKGTELSVGITLTDEDNHPFKRWEDITNGVSYNDLNHYSNFVLNENLTIQPVTKETYSIFNSSPFDAKDYMCGYATMAESCDVGDTFNIDVFPSEGYEFACIQLQTTVGVSTTCDTVISMPNEDLDITVYFWDGKNPTGKSLVYTGEEQELVAPGVMGEIINKTYGEPDDGVFEYSLTGDTDDYSPQIPKAKYPGEYKIYYRVIHDPFSSYWDLDRYGSVKTTISKIDYDMSGITFPNLTVTYDGNKHMPTIVGNLPSEISVKYYVDNIEFTGTSKVGVYNVTAKFESSVYNSISDMTAVLTINKASYDLSDVLFLGAEVEYDGQMHMLGATNLPSGVSVKYYVDDAEFSGAINAGTYEVVAKFFGDTNHNEIVETKRATLKILPAAYEGLNITFVDNTVPFDGNNQNILVSGELPEGVSVKYYVDGEEFNGASEPGIYNIEARFSVDSNHQAINSLYATLTIEEPESIVIDLLWLVILLACLDIALGVGLYFLLKQCIKDEKNKVKEKKVEKKISKTMAVAPAIVLIPWQIILIVTLGIIFVGLLAVDVYFVIKWKKNSDK